MWDVLFWILWHKQNSASPNGILSRTPEAAITSFLELISFHRDHTPAFHTPSSGRRDGGGWRKQFLWYQKLWPPVQHGLRPTCERPYHRDWRQERTWMQRACGCSGAGVSGSSEKTASHPGDDPLELADRHGCQRWAWNRERTPAGAGWGPQAEWLQGHPPTLAAPPAPSGVGQRCPTLAWFWGLILSTFPKETSCRSAGETHSQAILLEPEPGVGPQTDLHTWGPGSPCTSVGPRSGRSKQLRLHPRTDAGSRAHTDPAQRVRLSSHTSPRAHCRGGKRWGLNPGIQMRRGGPAGRSRSHSW